MIENRLKALWAADETVINGWLHIPSSWSAEVMAHAGWHSVTIDLQHGMHGIETVIQMLQAINTTATVPIVRVNWNEPGIVMRLLDAGAYGIICPMVNTRAECEAFVGACRYPPLGYRSLGPTRAVLYAGADYVQHANKQIITMAMIETAEAVDNIDAIASVDGLDALFIGTGDLLLSLTAKGQADTYDEAISRILDACQRHDRVAGLFTTSTETAREMIARGFRFVTVKTDSMLLLEYARQIVNELKSN